jgi:uncharacterized protein YjbI with pentapeptide repeats
MFFDKERYLMSEQNGTQKTTLKRPANDDEEGWEAYWKAQGQPWRTEPEIDVERQKYLVERRAITPNIEKGIYPFKDIKLNRADVEWLLATHENGRGPIEWNYEDQPRGKGLDLRGADLRFMDLHGLPLVSIRGGLSRNEHVYASLEQRHLAVAHLEGANLSLAHLEGADLLMIHLEGANLKWAHLEGADLFRAHLEGAYLRGAYLGGASLRSAFLDATTSFTNVILKDKNLGCVWLADIHWGDVNLTRTNWAQIKMLGDEHEAERPTLWDGKMKNKDDWLIFYQWAVRANRQIAVALQGQGLNEDAARFNYRAQLLQRKVFWHQRKFGQYLFSLFLDLLSGYGYRPGRCFIAYLLVILSFAVTYFIIGHKVGPVLSPLSSVVFSMTSFHGRGFFPGGIGLDDPLTVVAAFEAFIGLLIEVTFIATLTQRLFGK